MADREELEEQKLQAEIDLLRLQLEIEKGKKDKEEKNKESKIEAAEKRIKNWLPLILTIVAIGAGLWGLFEPISNFVRERQRAYEVDWNEKMIGFVNDLSSEDQSKVNTAIMMLSAYELDALPFLLFKLEETRYTSTTEVDLIQRALRIIHDKTSLDKDKFNALILKSAHQFFESGKGKKMNDMENKVDGLINYITILGNFGADNKKNISDFFVMLDTTIEIWSISKFHVGKIKKVIIINSGKLQE